MADKKNNTGDWNTGNRNTGNRNTGDLNTGDRNTGDWNTGNRNTGYLNTGDWNTGHRNTGYRNTGNRNTGDLNTGYLNTGDWNTGNRNTGNRNTGDRNTGNRNTGNRNTGDWNTGNRNTGYLNTGDGVVTFFGKPCPDLTWEQADELIPYCDLPVWCEWVESSKMTEEEKKYAPSHVTTGGFLRVLSKSIQEAFPLVWAKADVEWKRRWINLPHFDADMFVILTGVDVRLDKSLYPQVSSAAVVEVVPESVVINGRKYVLAKE